MRQRKQIDDGQDGIVVLVVSFVIDGGIDGRVLAMSFFIQSTEVRRQMGLRMKGRSIGVANDRMVEIVLLYDIDLCLVS